jgi:hypothetical protein
MLPSSIIVIQNIIFYTKYMIEIRDDIKNMLISIIIQNILKNSTNNYVIINFYYY